MKSWWIIGLVVVALVVVGVAYAAWSGGAPVDVDRITRGDIREYVDEEAKTRLADTYLITMPHAGRITAIEITEGAKVTKGQVVARTVPLDSELTIEAATAAVERLKASIRENDDVSVESTGLKQALSYVESMNRTVDAAAARVKSGEAKLSYSEKNLARVRRAFERKAVTENEHDQAETAQVEASVGYQQDVLVHRAIEAISAATALLPTAVRQYIGRKSLSHDVLEKQLAEAEVKLREAQRDRDRGTMVSPVDGVVLERAVTNERQLAAGTVLLRIGRLEDLEVEADILSQEVVRIKPGQTVEVSGPAIGSPIAKATVDRIYPAGFTKISSLGVEQQRVKVICKFDDQELRRLRSERSLGVDYRIRVRVFTAEKSGALTVPRSALFRGANGQWRLFTVRSGSATLTPVKLGLVNDDRAEVLEGVSEGELAIVAPETSLSEGQAVRPRKNLDEI